MILIIKCENIFISSSLYLSINNLNIWKKLVSSVNLILFSSENIIFKISINWFKARLTFSSFFSILYKYSNKGNKTFIPQINKIFFLFLEYNILRNFNKYINLDKFKLFSINYFLFFYKQFQKTFLYIIFLFNLF